LNLIRVMPAKGSDDFSSPQPNTTLGTRNFREEVVWLGAIPGNSTKS